VQDALAAIYPGGDVPLPHLTPLAEQIEAQTARYEVREETVEVALALVKPEGFTKGVSPIFYSLKSAHVDNERLTRTTKSCANTFPKPAHYAITVL